MVKNTWICLSGLILLLAVRECRAQGYTITTIGGEGVSRLLPIGVTVDASGNIYVPQVGNSVSRVSPTGVITPLAGSQGKGSGFSGDGGPAINAQFNFGLLSSGIVVDAAGNVYLADTTNMRVRRISASGTIMTVAGGGTLNPNPSAFFLGDGGPATAAVIPQPRGVALDPAGNLYIADSGAYNRVRKVTPDGNITTVAGCLILAGCFNLGDGGPATSANLSGPSGIAVDAAGNLYIADTFNNRIRKVSTDGTITTVAGSSAGSYQGDGGPATSAGLYQPSAVAVDAAGNLFIDDAGNFRIRMVNTGGTISTIAGTGAQRQMGDPSGDGGPAINATFGAVTSGVALGPNGTIYVADPLFGLRVLKLPAGSAPTISGIVSASAFGQFPSVAPGSWIELYGSSLATGSRSWSSADFNGVKAPTALDGTTVSIGGQAAFVDYISPSQVNTQVPSGVANGSQPVIVSTPSGLSAPYTVQVDLQQPGLLAPASFQFSGKQYAAALLPDGVTYVLPAASKASVAFRPAHAGETITLYGVGFGAVTPDIPAGQIVQQSNRLALPLHVLFGGQQGTVSFAGLAPGAVGLYQINVTVPSAASGDAVPLTFDLNGTPGTQTLYIAVQ